MGTGNMEFDNVQLDVEFSQASERDNITSRENIALSFGKLSTWFEALVPEGGSSGQILGWKSSGKAEWINSPASMDEKVKVDKFVSTTQTDYLLTGAVASMATTAGHLVVDNADGVASARMRLQKGTTDTIGQSMIMLGNNIPSGTSKNMQGMILMYSSSDKYGKIVSESLTDNRTWTLPDKTGTIAMTSDITPVNNGKLTIKGGTTSVAEFTANQSGNTEISIIAGSNVTIEPDTGNSKITISSSDTKVTSAANHYTPSRDTSADKTASASGATAAWSIDVVKGVTLQTDGKGHVTAVAVTSGKIPANPNTDTKVTSADNHYAPATVSGQDKSASASGATAAWSIDVVKGVTLNTDGKGHVTGLSVTSGKIPANPVPSNNVTGNAAWTAADRILVTNAASGNVIKQSAYTIGATLNSGTTNQLAYYSGANAISATHDGTHTVDSLYFKTGTNAKSARQIILGMYGQTYGNDGATLISGTAGAFSYGDGGPQIDFNTSVSGSQAGALVFTDHDSAAYGASWHFVSNQPDWNVTSKRFHARTAISIGTTVPPVVSDSTATNYPENLYVVGTSKFTYSDFGQIHIVRTGSTWAAGIKFSNSNGLLGAIGMTGNVDTPLIRWAHDLSTAYTIIDTSLLNVTESTNLTLDGGTNAFGYVSGLTKTAWNFQQTDGTIIRQYYSGLWKTEIFMDYRTGQMSTRGKNNGTWQDWRIHLDSGNYTSYTVTKKRCFIEFTVDHEKYLYFIEGCLYLN